MSVWVPIAGRYAKPAFAYSAAVSPRVSACQCLLVIGPLSAIQSFGRAEGPRMGDRPQASADLHGPDISHHTTRGRSP